MKNITQAPVVHTFLSLTTVVAAIAGLSACGGGSSGQMIPPSGQLQYPPGQTYYPQGATPGSVIVPQGTRCASAMPTLSGLPLEFSALSAAMVDGEPGCVRLVSVDQYQDTTSGGTFFNSLAGETDISYRRATLNRRRRRGVQLDFLATSVSNRTTCSDIRATPFGTPGTSVELPLWVDRSTGAIGQNMRVYAGSASFTASVQGNISTSRSGWNLNAFIQNLQAQGMQAIQAAKLSNGDIEIYMSRTRMDPATGASFRHLTRAVYSTDY